MDETTAMMTLLVGLLFAAGCAWWAKEWGRSPWVFGLIGLLSPMISAIALLIVGRNKE